LALDCDARSEVGRRANNEDAVYASPRVAAVADGVGGAVAGEVASWAIIHAIIHLDKCRLEGSLSRAVAHAVAWGNQTIGFIAECRPEMAGMSTTLTAVALDEAGAYVVANVGDSRTYLLRDGVLVRLTRDDSLVQRLIDEGELTEADAGRHPGRNIVVDALDGRPRPDPALATVHACAGDRLLLCSDGLSDVVDDQQLAAALALPSRSACADRLVELAFAAGSRDNVSVVVADVVSREDLSLGWA
jgi:PPM family protein phosphatase